MRFDKLSSEAQDGLRKWAIFEHEDEAFFDGIYGGPEAWAWICFQLRVAEDRPEWFPKGKFATIQVIEQYLYDEAAQQRRQRYPAAR